MKLAYEFGWKPSAGTAELIAMADVICSEYAASGYGLTLRQLYYQFVSRGLIPNNDRSYKRLGGAVNKGRMAGMIDWSHLVDRTRNPTLTYTGEPPEVADVIRQAKYGYATDKWMGQDYRVEVWVEKEALGEVVQRAASRVACASLACKGYMSASEMWEASQRYINYMDEEQTVVILHLGDHDPSGIDMTRDIRDRLTTFIEGHGYHHSRLIVDRIALNMDQIEQYTPPPNPAKLTDSRGTGYVEQYGWESWELDALPPDVLGDLIDTNIRRYLDPEPFNAQIEQQERVRSGIDEAAEEIAARFTEGEN